MATGILRVKKKYKRSEPIGKSDDRVPLVATRPYCFMALLIYILIFKF
jgi:hypothetical protein